jgi:hypothetical protein
MTNSEEGYEMVRTQKKRTLPAERPTEPHLLSDDAPVHLPMAYAQWLPAVDERPAGKRAKKMTGKRASRKGVA